MEEFNILNLLLILLSAWIGGALVNKIGYPAILGELLVGIILGPSVLGILKYTDMIGVLAEVGIILLMVYIGMEIGFKDFGKASWPGLLAALGGFLIPFILGYFVIIFFGGTQISALFVAIAVGVTSLATKSRILVDLNLLNTRIANVLMVGALISDTLALIIFAGIMSFAGSGSINTSEILLVIGKAVIFFAVTSAIGLYLLPVIGKYFNRLNLKSSTLYFTLLLIIAFGFAEMAEIVGMHGILGAFIAGLFIKDAFNKKIFKDINKVFHDVSIGFLAPIFFVSAGFYVNIHVFQTDLLLLIVIVFVALIGKIVGTSLFYLPSGYGWREGITVGMGMNGRGAVEIIIAGIGLQMGIIDNNIFSILVFMAIFTTLTVPVLLTWSTNWLKKRGELIQTDKRKGYLILGANAVSIYIAKYLQNKEEVILIDSNYEMVMNANKQGIKCIHGNALKEEIMTEAKAFDIKTFIGLTNNSEINLLAAQLAHDSFSIPQKYVLFTPGNQGAHIELLNPINASSMFAMKTLLDPWIQKFNTQQITEKKEIVNEKISTRFWIKKNKRENSSILPVLIEDKNGNYRPFQYNDTIEYGEKVVILK